MTNDKANTKLNNNWSFAVISSRLAMAATPFPENRDMTRTLPTAGTSTSKTNNVHKGKVPAATQPAIQPKGNSIYSQ